MENNKEEDLIYNDDFEEKAVNDQDIKEVLEVELISGEIGESNSKNEQEEENQPSDEDYLDEQSLESETREMNDIDENEPRPIIKVSRSTRIRNDLIYKSQREEPYPVSRKDKLKE